MQRTTQFLLFGGVSGTKLAGGKVQGHGLFSGT